MKPNERIICNKFESIYYILFFHLVHFQGRPVAPRLPEEPHVNIEVKGEASVEVMEKKLLDEINSRNKDGKMELHKDAGFAENPMDREDITGMGMGSNLY